MGRLTGRAGLYSIGLLNIQTEDKPAANAVATNFTALRLKRNIFRRSNLGVIATRRGPSVAAGRDASYSVGVDATLLFFKSINLTSYYARTSVPGVSGDTASYRGRPPDARAWEWAGGCELRGVRGGSWATRPVETRAAARGAEPQGLRQSDLGFRVVRDL